MKDNINPDYYRKKIEVTDFIMEYALSFAEGCIVKYIVRWKVKNGLEDLKKARWYLDKLIKQQENEDEV